MLNVIHRGSTEPGYLALAFTAMVQTPLLRVIADNRRPAAGAYICLVPMADPADLLPRVGLGWHYSELEPEILTDLRAGRSVLLFDQCSGGPAITAALLESLYVWVEANQLPAGQVIWLTPDRAAAERARAEAGMRANLIRFAYFDFPLRAVAWQFAMQARAPVLGRDVEAAIARLLDPASKDQVLLCAGADAAELGEVGGILPMPAGRHADPQTFARSHFSLVRAGAGHGGVAMAFCMGHPVLVRGESGQVAWMKALGFQDWSPVLDRSSELLPAGPLQVAAAMYEARRQAGLVRASGTQWLMATREVSAFNIRHAMSGGLLHACNEMIDARLIELLRGLID